MIIKWQAIPGFASIERIECTRETESSVFYASMRGGNEYRYRKMSEGTAYFDTWAEAHAHLTQHAANRVLGARRQLELANSYAGNVKGMRAPVEAPT